MNGYSVRKVKSFRGREGYGYNAELVRDDVPVAFVINGADGGETRFEWTDYQAPRVAVECVGYNGKPVVLKCTPEEARLREQVKGRTVTMMGVTVDMGPDLFVASLVDTWEMQSRKRSHAKPRKREVEV